MIENPILPNAASFLIPGGETGIVLIHGFSSTPEEMRPLGDALAAAGYSVYGVRLTGHGTHPEDMKRAVWQDWLADIEDGLAYLDAICSKKVLIGQSMGGMLALTAAAYIKPDAVIALSTPHYRMNKTEVWFYILMELLRPMVKKKVALDPEFGIRREANYPAYGAYPTKIMRQLYGLSEAMHSALPEIDTPVLVVQSRADDMVPSDSLDKFDAAIQSAQKRTVWLEGLSHGMAMDENNQVLFDKLLAYLEEQGLAV